MRRVIPGLLALMLAGASHAGTISVHVTTADGTPVPEAVISAQAIGGATSTHVKPGAKALMMEQDKLFMPFVLPIQVGTTVAFPNRDPFRHQVYSFSSAKTFELKLTGASEGGTVTFNKEGAIPLGCNIHGNMLAYIYVVDTPYFTTTSAMGMSKLAQVPDGTYAVKVWHPDQRDAQIEAGIVTVSNNDNADLSVKIELKRQRTQRKPGAADETGY
jgi:plastocyanin